MKKIIKELIKKDIERDQAGLDEHKAISAILKPLNGKPINGQTLNKKRLGDFKLVYEYGMYKIKGNSDHLIGYDTDPVIDTEKFYNRFDTCHTIGAIERIKQNKKANIEKMSKLFGSIKRKMNDIQYLFGDIENEKMGSFNNPVFYDILREIEKINNINDRNIKMSDFYYIKKYRNNK